MVQGRLQGYRATLMLLGRAAGLSSLALATLASGPCGGDCTNEDVCATVEELTTKRDEGLAKASGGSAGQGLSVDDVNTATSWDGKSCPTIEEYRAINKVRNPGSATLRISTVHASDGRCCYHVEGDECLQGGRPFLVDGKARVASIEGSDEPASATHGWLADALVEHASVASFARLSLQLLALGAPAELVADCQRSSLDELRHADFFFELASRDAGTTLRPGPLPVQGALDDLSLAGLIESNLREGCIGETLAAEQLRQRASSLGDAKLADALRQIAEDETRHAALAFRILAWCRETSPELTGRIVERVLAESPKQAAEPTLETWQHVLSPLLGALT